MKRNIFALLGLAVLTVLVATSQADALQAQKAYKEMTLTVTVTPSPMPTGGFFFAPQSAAPPSAVAVAEVRRLLADPLATTQIAFAGPAYDVPPGSGVQIAQVSAQPTPVPVQFVAKPDPSAAFLRIIPHTPAISAPYGTSVWPCAFEVFTFYTNTYSLSDWGYGTLKTGATPFFPIENYPTVSDLSWAVPDFGPTVTPYNNAGPPGETTWTGAKNQSQQHCVDLTLTVPNAQAAGTYTATVQYNLYVTLP